MDGARIKAMYVLWSLHRWHCTVPVSMCGEQASKGGSAKWAVARPCMPPKCCRRSTSQHVAGLCWPFAGHSLNRCRCSCGITSPCARDKLNSPPALLLSSHLGRPHLSCCKGDPVFRRHGQRKWALRCHGRPAVHTAIISWDLSARTPGMRQGLCAWRAQWSEWTGPLAVAVITPHASASASREPVCTSRLGPCQSQYEQSHASANASMCQSQSQSQSHSHVRSQRASALAC